MKLLEFILPASWRTRAVPMPDRNDAVLGRLHEGDGVYRALMDHAFAQFENDVMAALQPGLDERQREFLCGRANGLAAYITQIEHTRVRAREVLQRKAAG